MGHSDLATTQIYAKYAPAGSERFRPEFRDRDGFYVVLRGTPYVIAVMTTHLPSLDLGRSFIRSLSKMAFMQEGHLAAWRTTNALPALPAFASIEPKATAARTIVPADVRYWQNPAATTSTGGTSTNR